MNMLHCVLKATKYEKQNPVSRTDRSFSKGSNYIFDTKALNLADVSVEFPILRAQLIVANSSERVYFLSNKI